MLGAMHSWLMEMGNDGRSPRTLAAYDSDVTDTVEVIAGLLGTKPTDLTLDQIDRDLLVASIADFRTRPDPRYTVNPDQAPTQRGPARVARRVAAIKVFFKWCYATGRIASDPAALLRSPKRPKRLPKALELTAATDLMGLPQVSRWPERDQLIVVLALTTGLRLEEMSTLKIADITGDPPTSLSVIGKGNKERSLPLPAITSHAIRAYMPTRRKRLDKLGLDSKTLFISTRPRKVGARKDGSEIISVDATRAGIAYVVDRMLSRIGARRRGSRVHVLRHTFATLGLRPDPNTGQPAYTLRQLQAALGHANLSTIQVYAEVSDAELVQAAAAHPLSHVKVGSGADQ